MTNTASSYQSRSRLGSIYTSVWPNCSVWCGEENKMFRGEKTCINWIFFKHCEQTDHHPTMQQYLEKVEAIEVLDCKWNKNSSKCFLTNCLVLSPPNNFHFATLHSWGISFDWVIPNWHSNTNLCVICAIGWRIFFRHYNFFMILSNWQWLVTEMQK